MNVLIVDDEAPARDRLRRLIEDTGEHTVVGDAANGKDALDLVARLVPDVVLLDIRMPGLNGIETAHHLNAFDKSPAIIFTTAYDEYAIDAFDAQAIGYVLKPVRRERLSKALAQAARMSPDVLGDVARASGFPESRSHVCARIHGALKLIPIGQVNYFHADQKYVRVHHSEGQDLIDDSLKSLEKEFGADFVRIHRSALVAVSKIDSLIKTSDGHTQVRLRIDDEDSHDLTIGRRQMPVEVPAGVDVKIEDRRVTAKGKLGELSLTLVDEVELAREDDKLIVSPKNDSKRARDVGNLSQPARQHCPRRRPRL